MSKITIYSRIKIKKQSSGRKREIEGKNKTFGFTQPENQKQEKLKRNNDHKTQNHSSLRNKVSLSKTNSRSNSQSIQKSKINAERSPIIENTSSPTHSLNYITPQISIQPQHSQKR